MVTLFKPLTSIVFYAMDVRNNISGIGVLKVMTLAKISGLDDSSLKRVQYYPYDMVHRKKNKNDVNNAG